MERAVSPLLTDLYQLTMLQAYLDCGMNDVAVFEFFVRKLPSTWNFLVAAGLDDVLTYLEELRFSQDELVVARVSRFFIWPDPLSRGFPLQRRRGGAARRHDILSAGTGFARRRAAPAGSARGKSHHQFAAISNADCLQGGTIGARRSGQIARRIRDAPCPRG